MVDIVVFGTGSNGERAWRAAAELADINVVCFADNDLRKQGVELHDRVVVTPDGLREKRWDFIVLASMYAPEIQRQLHGLGIPVDRVVAPDPNRFAETFAELPARKRAARSIRLDDNSSVLERDLPSILILSGTLLNLDDEASLPVRAMLADFPQAALCNVARRTVGRPWLSRSIVLPDACDVDLAGSAWRELNGRGFQPGVILGVVRRTDDLALVESLLRAVPDSAPVVLHVLGGDPPEIAKFERRTLAARTGRYELWAAGAPLADAMQDFSSRPVTAILPFTQEAVAAGARSPRARRGSKRRRSAESRLRTVILGGIADPAMVRVLREAWVTCREVMPSLPAIDWYVQPADAQALVNAGGELGGDIQWRGSHDTQALCTRLAEADLAIVPVNSGASATSGAARFELPARLADLCRAGLPILAIASPDTAVARLIDAWQCGFVVSGQDTLALAARVIELAGDPERRAALGARAREVADSDLAPRPQRMLAVSRLVRLGRTYTPPTGSQGPRKAGLVRLTGSERAPSARLEDVLTDRIHYACGRNVLSGWLNVDGYDESFPNGEIPDNVGAEIFRLDLTGPHPFPDNFFRLGYSEDFVEHIEQAEFAAFLCECYRTFQPGGILRLSSPGLEGILRRHLRGSDWKAADVLREEAYTRWWHKHFLCSAEVDAIARHIGWRDVHIVPYGESSIPDLRQDTRPQQADLNLVVELVK